VFERTRKGWRKISAPLSLAIIKITMNKEIIKSTIKQLKEHREAATNIGIDVDASIVALEESLSQLKAQREDIFTEEDIKKLVAKKNKDCRRYLKKEREDILKKIERRLNKLKGKKADIEIIEFLEDLIKILK